MLRSAWRGLHRISSFVVSIGGFRERIGTIINDDARRMIYDDAPKAGISDCGMPKETAMGSRAVGVLPPLGYCIVTSVWEMGADIAVVVQLDVFPL